MKKLMYFFLCLVLSCVSFDFTKLSVNSKENRDKIIEEQSKTALILKPFKLVGLWWSCTPDENPDGGGSHRSHQSHSSHSSHYSSH